MIYLVTSFHIGQWNSFVAARIWTNVCITCNRLEDFMRVADNIINNINMIKSKESVHRMSCSLTWRHCGQAPHGRACPWCRGWSGCSRGCPASCPPPPRSAPWPPLALCMSRCCCQCLKQLEHRNYHENDWRLLPRNTAPGWRVMASSTLLTSSTSQPPDAMSRDTTWSSEGSFTQNVADTKQDGID